MRGAFNTIKVTTNLPEVVQKPFPKLMVSKWHVVLFTEEGKGMVIAIMTPNVSSYCVGHCREYWYMKYFEDYNEPITLQNE